MTRFRSPPVEPFPPAPGRSLIRVKLAWKEPSLAAQPAEHGTTMESVDRVRFINHKGKQILIADFTRCRPDEVETVTEEVRRVVTAQPEGSVLIMADFADAQFSRDAVTRLKEVTTYDRPYVKRAAWVHTGTLPKVLYDAIQTFSQRKFPTFATRDEALEFLTQE